MIKRDGIYLLEAEEKENLPTETDPILANGAPVREGDKYYVGDTGEVGIFVNGKWTAPEDIWKDTEEDTQEDTQEGE